ncbi:MAG: DUF1016 domain-containing protein [Taibaiella sp.]|nr:DUF1016 domain-containing protein [Taibaiella sp.]
MTVENQFTEIISLISQSRAKAYQAANRELIDLYWNIGAYISRRIESEGWGKGTVLQLAEFIQKREPGISGFSDKNLWRMKQFYETYKDSAKLSPLVRELNWTNNITILSRSKTIEEKEFYLKLCVEERYTKRELERQINASVYERFMLSTSKLSAPLRVLQDNVNQIFKDTYVLEFLRLPEEHPEGDLQKGLIANMKQFILELGKDFLFVGEEYRVQVGNTDFFIDLLFYHRGLQSLVAFELKSLMFKPEHLGKLNFYLEALDRDVKKPNENPSIGVLLCRDKDQEVVEYALSRHLSPTLISQYTTVLPDKKLLQAKLHELYELYDKKEMNDEQQDK